MPCARLLHVNSIAKDIRGVRIVEQPAILRHFTAKFEPLQQVPR
jgi:tryptophanase